MNKLAVFVSGKGSLLEALIQAGIPLALVLSDRPCRGIDIATAAKIKTVVLTRTTFNPEKFAPQREAYTSLVASVLDYYGIDFVIMAGFMTILSPSIFGRYRGRITNNHPSLLPAFKGEKAVKDAFDAGVEVTGMTIHIATEQLDDGPILIQEEVRRLPDDTVETLHERIKQVERPALVKVVRRLLEEAGPILG